MVIIVSASLMPAAVVSGGPQIEEVIGRQAVMACLPKQRLFPRQAQSLRHFAKPWPASASTDVGAAIGMDHLPLDEPGSGSGQEGDQLHIVFVPAHAARWI